MTDCICPDDFCNGHDEVHLSIPGSACWMNPPCLLSRNGATKHHGGFCIRDGESASTVMDGNCSPSFLHKPWGPCILVLASPSIHQEALTSPAIAVENATLAEHELNLSMAHGASDEGAC
ncbi:hypothetical protein VPH35_089323 [Triticum aestivum]